MKLLSLTSLNIILPYTKSVAVIILMLFYVHVLLSFYRIWGTGKLIIFQVVLFSVLPFITKFSFVIAIVRSNIFILKSVIHRIKLD